MKLNVGNYDRIARALLATVLFVLAFTGTVSGILGITFIILGGVFLGTAIVGFCPIYYFLRTGTLFKKEPLKD